MSSDRESGPERPALYIQCEDLFKIYKTEDALGQALKACEQVLARSVPMTVAVK